MKTKSTNTITMILILPGIAIAYALVLVKKAGIMIDYPVQMILLMIASFLWGLTGFVWVLRREAQQAILVRGKSAVMLGLTLMITCWGFVIYGFYLLIDSLF